MKKDNAILMTEARESLKGRWGFAIGVFLIYMIIVGAVNSIKGWGAAASIIITGPLSLGLAIFSLAFSRNKETKITQIFEGFNDFARSVVAFLWMFLFVILWSILLIVPGIIAALSYSQLFYILADDPAISAKEALKKSKKMMYGYKWKYFCLGLRFLGWFILSILTLGIGFLWLAPYANITMAKFYEDVSKID